LTDAEYTLENNTKGNPLDFSFPKEEKLKSKTLLEKLFTEGKNLTQFPMKLIYLPTEFKDQTHIKVAVVAPKKKFKKAIDRNRVKRLLREAYRLNKPLVFNNIEGSYAFLFLYLGNRVPGYDEVDKTMKQLLASFLKKEFHEKID